MQRASKELYTLLTYTFLKTFLYKKLKKKEIYKRSWYPFISRYSFTSIDCKGIYIIYLFFLYIQEERSIRNHCLHSFVATMNFSIKGIDKYVSKTSLSRLQLTQLYASSLPVYLLHSFGAYQLIFNCPAIPLAFVQECIIFTNHPVIVSNFKLQIKEKYYPSSLYMYKFNKYIRRTLYKTDLLPCLIYYTGRKNDFR